MKKAFEVFCANTYLFDKFFGRPIIPVEKWEGSNLAVPEFAEQFAYSGGQSELADFSEWLNRLTTTSDFKRRCDAYVEIFKQLKSENNRERRQDLLTHARQLEEEL